jgi:antitoxin (DNA-binding transcriptional repressor) of toxin-antitoxin stability system
MVGALLGQMSLANMACMDRVTISQLKNSLSAYLRKVRAGETVLILDREEPIAMLQRVAGTDHVDGRLLRLEQAGVIRRSPTGDPREALAATRPPRPKASVVEALLEERRAGR